MLNCILLDKDSTIELASRPKATEEIVLNLVNLDYPDDFKIPWWSWTPNTR